MENFIPGQRWISNTESELGLGLVLEVSFKRVTVLYLASNEERIYAIDNAPLSRVRFLIGDTIESTDEEKFIVSGLLEKNGLITYQTRNSAGEEGLLDEIELNHHIQFNKPQDRLFTGQIDPNSWFMLRYDTWRRLQKHQQSPVKGLLGGRTSLIAHQLYIAHEAATRSAPRLMLADEVGLGKTIEAGLILHHRLIHGLSRRVLVIVPESLLHQWLVEMLRRFNLRFSVFDEARCLEELGDNSILAGAQTDEDDEVNAGNPFVNAQLILASQEFFSTHPNRQRQAILAGWDMVIVDEAHHLQWSPTSASPEYLFVEHLGLTSPGLILLTATPEQLGKESHFARLRLLDADRFYSLENFLAEEKRFEPVAKAAQLLLSNDNLNEGNKQLLSELLKDDNVTGLLSQLDDPNKSANARTSLVNILLDHHGTGRILFRNSRHTVQGFPERERYGYSLRGEKNTADLLQDSYYLWLVEHVRHLAGEKILVICKAAQTVIDLEQTLRTRAGIASAVFHEGMTIIERDRAAAYFADPDSSARLLICSEIGSEGRNFQFVQHLVLLDLPSNPDLLQQRIGRLDRIGQKHIIQIHVPYLQNSEQAVLYRWYDEGLDAFRHNSSAAQGVADALQDDLQAVIHSNDLLAINAFIDKTQALHAQLEEQMHQGRDPLLELNSCRKDIADGLIAQLEAYDHEGALWPYLEELFECYGVDTEYHSPDCFIIRPSDHLRVAHFPELPEDGLTVTVNRAYALAREELQFMTWEHPLVTSAMDLVLSSETGNASVSVVKHPLLKGGQFLLECLFIAECSAPEELQVSRFLPHTPIRILIDQTQKNMSEAIGHESLIDNGVNFDKSQIVAFLNKQRSPISAILQIAEQYAKTDMENLINKATETLLAWYSAEIKRLARLQKVNPSIKPEEIEQLKDMATLAHGHIQTAQLRLDAVRFIITH